MFIAHYSNIPHNNDNTKVINKVRRKHLTKYLQSVYIPFFYQAETSSSCDNKPSINSTDARSASVSNRLKLMNW